MSSIKFWCLTTLTVLIISCTQEEANKVLIFSKTDGFRHESIPDGIKMVKNLGTDNNFEVESTEDASVFRQSYLKDFKVVVFLNTTMDVLNPAQQLEFERFIQAGGGFVGVHAAADTEYDWPWYGKLVGAYFNGHPNNPNVRDAIVRKTENAHACTDHLPDSWPRTDEWYNYKNINPNIIPVLNLDETTYEGGTNGDFHPIAWYHEYDGGRAFYTGGGHTSESYEDDNFRNHFLEGLLWTMGNKTPVDYSLSSVAPAESRFQKIVLDSYFNEPMELELLPDGRIVFIERKGSVKLYDPSTGSTSVIAQVEVYSGHEDGLLGIALDPNYSDNKWAYICYSDTEEPVQNVSRFVFDPDAEEVLSNEVVVIRVPVQREECCHSAGSVEFGPEGNLWVSFGDNTNPHQSNGFAPIDERPGRFPFDAQKSSGNGSDLRGGIIRITPQDDGTYTIPNGNLFPKDGSAGKPEIYVMGCRNPFRFSIDSETGNLYWGDVGPDANEDGPNRGPRGYDEVNQAKQPGFFGWPYFIGNNKAYNDYNFARNNSGELFDPLNPVNDSPNNSGPGELPAAQPAMVYYPYAESVDFPLVGSGGRNAMAGPIFHRKDYPDNPRRYPAYYDGKFFMYEWMRGWMMAVSFDENGDFKSMEPFLPSVEWNNLMDVVMSPEGDMFMIEYGSGWFTANQDARLVHLKYTPGNRSPVAKASADQTAGGLPLEVTFDGSKSSDNDGDELKYLWDFGDGQRARGEMVNHTFETGGEYQVTLTVTDPENLQSTDQVKIFAGNNPPEVSLSISGNSSFYWPGTKLPYEVTASDIEDADIREENLTLTIDYLEMGYDLTEIAQGHQLATEVAGNHPGNDLILNSDCRSCHQVDGISVGPSYVAVAQKYRDQEGAREYLAEKIIQGGGGVWGETPMAAHPAIPEGDAQIMANYILTLGEPTDVRPLPGKGSLTFEVPDGKKAGGSFVLLASYTDGGAAGVGPMRVQETRIFRSPNIPAPAADAIDKATKFVITPELNPALEDDLEVVIASHEGVLTYQGLDMTGVGSLTLVASAPAIFASGGTIYVHLDDLDNEAVGSAVLTPSMQMGTSDQLNIPLNDVSGIHDLILRTESNNEGAPAGILIMLVLNPALPG